MIRPLHLFVCLPLVLAAVPAASQAGEAECQAVVAAFTRLAEAPAYRQTVTLPGVGTMAMATIGDTLYAEADGAWTKLPLRPGGRKEMMQQIIGTRPLENCEAAGSETVDGVATAIFAYRVPPIEGISPEPSDQRVWIADADGLPVRMVSADGTEVSLSFAPFDPPVP